MLHTVRIACVPSLPPHTYNRPPRQTTPAPARGAGRWRCSSVRHKLVLEWYTSTFRDALLPCGAVQNKLLFLPQLLLAISLGMLSASSRCILSISSACRLISSSSSLVVFGLLLLLLLLLEVCRVSVSRHYIDNCRVVESIKSQCKKGLGIECNRM